MNVHGDDVLRLSQILIKVRQRAAFASPFVVRHINELILVRKSRVRGSKQRRRLDKWQIPKSGILPVVKRPQRRPRTTLHVQNYAGSPESHEAFVQRLVEMGETRQRLRTDAALTNQKMVNLSDHKLFPISKGVSPRRERS